MANFKLNSTITAMMEAGNLQGECHKDVVDALNHDKKALKQWKKACDSLRAVGITAAMIATEAKGGVAKLRDAVRQTCIDALTPAEKAIYSKEYEALSEAEKKTRADLQKDVGRNLGKIETHMRKAESDGTKTPNPPRTRKALIAAALDDFIGWLTGDDDGSLVALDLPRMTKDARALRTLAN